MNAVFITIGNRDVALKNTDLPGKPNECRKNGDFILKRFKKLEDKIELPIIKPFLLLLADRNIQIDRIFLIATDQEDERYQNSDSINYAKVIKKCFKMKNIKTSIIAMKDNVNDFIYNYDFFQKKLAEFNSQKINNVYMLSVGGMPNINTPLILSSILVFREKVHQYYVDQVQKNCYPVPFNQKLLHELEKEKILDSLNKYFYASIAGFSSKKIVQLISDYAYNRLNFNLVNAKNIADDLIEQFPERNLRYLSESITEIRNSLPHKINEIFFSAYIKVQQKQYVDALLRLYSFIDNLLFEEVCKLYDLPDNGNSNFEKWWKKKAVKKINDNHPDIEEKLEIEGIPNPDLKRSGIPLYLALIRFKDQNNNIFKISNPMISVSKLRNKSIAAHGFEGVSLKKINDRLKPFKMNFKVLLDNIEDFLGKSFKDSIYTKIDEIIKNEYKL